MNENQSMNNFIRQSAGRVNPAPAPVDADPPPTKVVQGNAGKGTKGPPVPPPSTNAAMNAFIREGGTPGWGW